MGTLFQPKNWWSQTLDPSDEAQIHGLRHRQYSPERRELAGQRASPRRQREQCAADALDVLLLSRRDRRLAQALKKKPRRGAGVL